jgi:NhaP-type Na+/H+ or K+/H+ antiporter
VAGSILSATDPVAVVALLKELGGSERRTTLMEGASSLSDGTTFVIFQVFFFHFLFYTYAADLSLTSPFTLIHAKPS